MQFLTPPENEILNGQKVSTRRLQRNTMLESRTGSRTPQRATRLVHSFRTNAPVGTHRRPDPTDPGSCHENNNMSVPQRLWWLYGKEVQVVSRHRDGDNSSFRNR